LAGLRSLLYLGFIVVAVAGWLLKRRPKVSSSIPSQRPEVDQDNPLTLQAALQDSHWQVRLEAVQGISAQHSAENLSLLLSMFSDADSDVREAAAAGVERYGSDALDGLHHVLNTGNLNARETAIQSLWRLHDPHSTPALINALLHDESAWVRSPAAQALGRLGDDEALHALIQSLSDTHPDVKQAVRAALAQIGTPEALAALSVDGLEAD
jgi:HEAT repeat protein